MPKKSALIRCVIGSHCTAAAIACHRVLHRGRLRLPRPGHPVPRRADLVQRAPGPVRRADPAPYPGKATAEIHDYHDTATGVLAASLAKRAAGYTSLGFPDPRRIPHTPSSRAAREVTESLA